MKSNLDRLGEEMKKHVAIEDVRTGGKSDISKVTSDLMHTPLQFITGTTTHMSDTKQRTMYLGVKILQNAFKKSSVNKQKKRSNITALGLIGGFIDSFGGGGWGPLVTGTFIKNGHTPRFVIGSSTFAKCILTMASAVTFIFTIGIQHWNVVAGLLIGGIVTAPFSAMLTAKLPTKKMFIAVGVVVIFCGLVTVYRAIFL